MNSVRSNSLSLKYQRFPLLGCQDKWFISRNWWVIRGRDGSWVAGGDDD